MISREFKLYLNAGTGIAPVINANQFDEGEEWIFTLLESDGTVYTPSTGSIIGLKSDGTTILDAGTVNAEGQVVITETVQMTASSGKNVYELLLDGNSHGTANFIVFVEPRPGDIEHPSETELSLFEETIQAAGNVQQFQADISALQSGLATTNANLTSEANTRASADATLQSAISTEASTRSTQDAVLQAEIDQIIAPSGEAPSAAEVQNARIGVDGTTYDTLGNAIRGQVGDLKNALNIVSSNIDEITQIGKQLFDKDNAETEHWLPANNTVSAGTSSTSVIIPVSPSDSDEYITVHRNTISSRFTVATFTEKPAIGSTPVTLTGNNSASAITVACDTTITYIMVLVHNATYDTGITVQTMLDGLMVEFGTSYTGYEPYSFSVIIPDKSVNGDSFSDDGVEFITELVNELTEGEKAFTDSNRTDAMNVSDVSLTWTDGSYYDLTTGDIITLSGRSYSQKINCKYGDRISITNNKGQILFWKENDVLLSYVATSQNSTLTVVVPDGAVKYAFNNSDSTIRGTTATQYANTTPLAEYENVAPAKLIYDSDSFITGKYCSTSNGKISNLNSFNCLPFIPVKPNHKYRTQTQTQIVFYDETLTFISSLLPASDANNTGTTVEMDFVTPLTCKYISVNTKSAHEMLFDLDYVTVGTDSNSKKLKNRTVVCFGDSITGNYGFGDNYPYQIEKLTDAKTFNCGFGGCRMELVPSDSDVAFTNPFSMCGIVDALEKAKNGDADAWDDMDNNALTLSRMAYFRLQILKSIDWSKVDIVTIAYGTNEGGYPQDDESDKYNKYTYAGATRYAVEKLLTLYPKLRIVLLTPIYRYYTSEHQDSDTHVNPNYGYKLTDNVATLISVGRELKVPVIDMYYTLGINITNYTSYFGDEDEQSDGTHINSFGREEMGRRVAGELIRLM